MTEENTLYQIEIQTPVSPAELDRFTDIADEAGYTVVTDLECGLVELRDTAIGYTEKDK